MGATKRSPRPALMAILVTAATNGVAGHVGRAVREPMAHGAAIGELDFGPSTNDYIDTELCARKFNQSSDSNETGTSETSETSSAAAGAARQRAQAGTGGAWAARHDGGGWHMYRLRRGPSLEP